MLRPLFPSRPWLWLGRLALVVLVLGAVAAGGLTGFLLALVDEAPLMEEFEDYSPNLITRVIDRTGENTVAEFYVERRDFVPMPIEDPEMHSGEVRSEIPMELVLAFMAIEDERYLRHVGIDPEGLTAALFSYAMRGGPFGNARLRGASTITQQLARKTLETISDERTIERKIREAIAALRIERRYAKDQILEFYLNQIPMGNGLYGVEAAARAYFGVGVEDLSLAQCAAIAAIARAPEIYNPRDAFENAARGRSRHEPDDATWRRNLVLGNMVRLGYIGDDEYLAARMERITQQGAADRANRAPYFIDLVRRQIINDPSLGARALFNEGTTIRSTVDLELQRIAEETLVSGLATAEALWQSRKRLRYWEEEEEMGWRPDEGERRLVEIAEMTPTGLLLRFEIFDDTDYLGDAPLPANMGFFNPEEILQPGNLIDVELLEVNHAHKTFRARVIHRQHVQGALVVLDVHTGQILALVGGADWEDEFNDGQWNRAILGGRQPGSCFKPFVFACALENGMTPGTIFMDERVEFPTQPGSPPYVPRNFENRFFGPTTLVEALEHSRNVVTVRMTQTLGIRTLHDFVSQFDFAGTTSRWQIPPYINMGLGVHDVTPLELACAIASFANEGRIVRPTAWTQIDEASVGPIGETGPPRPLRRNLNPPERRVMSRQTARQVLFMMEQVIRSGSGQETIGDYLLDQPGMPALAGKTGTTTGTVDAWFAGMTPDWAVVVFVGFDDNLTLGPQMTGSRVAGPIWREFIERAVAVRPPTRMDFPEPPDLVHCDICSQTGLLWSEACEQARQESIRRDLDLVTRYRDVPFVAGTEPTQPCPIRDPNYEGRRPAQAGLGPDELLPSVNALMRGLGRE